VTQATVVHGLQDVQGLQCAPTHAHKSKRAVSVLHPQTHVSMHSTLKHEYQVFERRGS
jgi:hypothetical protein